MDKISRQYDIECVAWLLLITAILVYSGKEKVEQNKHNLEREGVCSCYREAIAKACCCTQKHDRNVLKQDPTQLSFQLVKEKKNPEFSVLKSIKKVVTNTVRAHPVNT